MNRIFQSLQNFFEKTQIKKLNHSSQKKKVYIQYFLCPLTNFNFRKIKNIGHI